MDPLPLVLGRQRRPQTWLRRTRKASYAGVLVGGALMGLSALVLSFLLSVHATAKQLKRHTDEEVVGGRARETVLRTVGL